MSPISLLRPTGRITSPTEWVKPDLLDCVVVVPFLALLAAVALASLRAFPYGVG